jgi:RNA polymerase sigma factor (sigma-70 family)
MSRTEQQPLPLLAAAAGVPPAAQRLLLNCRPALLDHVARHLPSDLRPQFDPADIAQAVYMRAFECHARLSCLAPDALRARLLAMADDHLLDLRRRRHAEKRAPELSVQEISPGPCADHTVDELLARFAIDTCTTCERAADEELYQSLWAAFEQLPEDQREVVRLHYICQLDPKDAAAQLGCSIWAFYRARDRALDTLRYRLGPMARWK